MLPSLKKVPLFSGMREEDLRAFADQAVFKTFAKNATIISEGSFTEAVYLLLTGKVKIYLTDKDGKELVLDIKGPGAYFGELALDDGPRSASVVTLETCRCAIVTVSDFKNLLFQYPEISLRVVRDLIHTVRKSNKNVRSLATLGVYARVSQLLRDLAVEQDGKLVVAENLSQQDMASRVGSSREMVNRIFRDLAQGGYIKVERKKITINKDLPLRW